VIPEDDPSIPDSEQLFRRVITNADAIVPLGDGRFRPSSAAFRDNEPLSVDLSSLSTAEQTRDRERSRRFHVAAVSVAAVRAAGCVVRRDRLDNNPAHALIYGHHASGGLTGGDAGKIAKQAVIVLPNSPLL